MRDYKKHKLRFSPYLEKLYQSDKPMIIYKFGNKYKIFTDFSKKIILNNSNIKSLNFNDIEEWDSIGHMSLMSALEDAFDISLDTEDIVDFSSYEKGKEILKKYGVKFN